MLHFQKTPQHCRSVEGAALSISDVNECDVYILDWSSQIQIDDCHESTFFIGPVAGSVFVRDCKNCKCEVALSRAARVAVCSACSRCVLVVPENNIESSFYCSNVVSIAKWRPIVQCDWRV
jgi:protein XRP2